MCLTFDAHFCGLLGSAFQCIVTPQECLQTPNEPFSSTEGFMECFRLAEAHIVDGPNIIMQLHIATTGQRRVWSPSHSLYATIVAD